MRDSVRSSRLPNDVRVSDGAEEDRRKVQADGFPSRAADDGRRSAARRRVLLSAIIVDLGADGRRLDFRPVSWKTSPTAAPV